MVQVIAIRVSKVHRWMSVNDSHNNILSQVTYIFSKTSTVHSLYHQIFVSSKESSLQVKSLFNSLKYGTWECSFSPMFYVGDFF